MAIGGGWGGVVRDVAIGGVLGLGCIKAIGIRALACVGFVAREEGARALG